MEILFTNCYSEAMPCSSARLGSPLKCRVSTGGCLSHGREVGLEEHPPFVYWLSWPSNSNSWHCHRYKSLYKIYLPGQADCEDKLLFVQNFIQTEFYSKSKGLKSVGINGKSVGGKYSVPILQENCCLKPVEVPLCVSFWV